MPSAIDNAAGTDNKPAGSSKRPDAGSARSPSTSRRTNAVVSSNLDPSPFSRPQQLAAQNVRYQQIAQVAYYRAERRAFAPGGEVDDWLAAEREVDGYSS